jgi:hypothetical protein
MKRILLAFALLLTFTGASFAQTTPKKPVTHASTTKKDGTADMRFKANKDAAKTKTATTTTHVKKDGTADKRFKENKTKK